MSSNPAQARLDRCAAFLQQDPNNLHLLAECAELALQIGKISQARDFAEKAAALSPQDLALKSRLATIAMVDGRIEDSININREILALGETSPVVHYNLAYALMLAARYSEAKEELIQIQNQTDQAPDAPHLMIQAMHHLGEVQEAIQFALKHLENHPADYTTMGLLSTLYVDTNDMTQAQHWAEKAITLNPDNPDALVTTGTTALTNEDEAQAKAAFEHALAGNPHSGRAWMGLGLTRMLGLDINGGLDNLKKAVTHMPNHIGTWHALAWCQILDKDLKGAKESFNSAMDLDRNFGETHGGLATIAVMEGRLDEARKLTERALKLNPMSFAGRFAQSLLLSGSGNQAMAQKIISKALSSHEVPGGGTLADMLKRVALKQVKKK